MFYRACNKVAPNRKALVYRTLGYIQILGRKTHTSVPRQFYHKIEYEYSVVTGIRIV